MRESRCMVCLHFVQNFRTFLLSLLLGSFCFSSIAQPGFERAYGGALNEEASLVRPTFDNGYVLVGTRKDTVNNTRAYYVLKLDSLGNEEWSRSYGDAFNQTGSSIVQTPDSGYAFVGSHQAALYSSVAEVVRINADGTLRDSRTYPPSDGWGTLGIGIVLTEDSSLAFSSYTDGFISQNFYSLSKLNSDLSIAWTNFVSFDGSVMNEHDATQGTYGRIFTLGHYPDFFYTAPSIPNVTEVRHLSSTGTLLLDSLYLWNSVSKSISATREGGMLVCGDVESSGNRNIFLTLLDSSGAVIWQKEFGSAINESSKHARQTSDGGFAVLGSVPHQYFPLLNDIFLTKVDANGDSLWTRYFGATFDDIAIHMQETYDGGFIILGNTNSFDSSHIYLIKTDSMGLINSPFVIEGPGNYFCKGDTVQINLNPVPSSNCVIAWSRGDSTDLIDVFSNGNYSATITDSAGNVFHTPNYFLFFANTADASLSNLDTIGICTGSRLENLVPTSLSFSYSWYLNDTLIPSATSNFYVPTRTGKYSLKVENYCGNDADTIVLNELYSLPPAPVMNFSGNKFICVGDSLQLSIPDSGLVYQWWFARTGNPQAIPFAIDTSLMASSEGSYFVQATDHNQCKSNSNTLNILLDNYSAYVNTSGPLRFCQGGHVILAAPMGSNYLWNTGDTVNSLFINTSGSFWYSMTSMFGCPKQSDTVFTEVYLKPYVNLGPDTTICNTGNYLIDAGPGYSSYRWQDGTTNQAFLAFTTLPGNHSVIYYVDVTDVNACSNRDSVVVHFEICQGTGLMNSDQSGLHVPSILSATDQLRVNNTGRMNAEIKFWNSTGQSIMYRNLTPGITVFPEGIFQSGMYFYTMYISGERIGSGKLVVQ